MISFQPLHPGEFIRRIYLEPLRLSHRRVARHLGVAPSTFNRLVNGHIDLSAEMAIRLAKTLGRTPESWMALQSQYDLHRAGSQVKLAEVKKLHLR